MHFHFWLLHATWHHFQCLNTCGNPMPRRLPSLIFHRFSCNLDHLPNPQLSWQQLHSRGGWFSGHLGWQLPGWRQQPCNRAAAWCRGVALYTPCVCSLEGYRGGGNLGHSDRRRWKFYGVLATFDGCELPGGPVFGCLWDFRVWTFLLQDSPKKNLEGHLIESKLF